MASPCGFRYSGFCLRMFGCSVFRVPLWMRRGAQGQTDQGKNLFERSELFLTPSGPSTTGCPQRSGGTQQPGSPFLLLTFGVCVTSLREVSKPRARSAPFGEQKKTRFAGFAKSELPPGNPRPAELRRERGRSRGKRGNSAKAGARPGLKPPHHARQHTSPTTHTTPHPPSKAGSSTAPGTPAPRPSRPLASRSRTAKPGTPPPAPPARRGWA